MYLFLTAFLIGQGAVFSASLDGAEAESYKSYKDHKVFSVTGDRPALVDLVQSLNDYGFATEDEGSFIVNDHITHLEVMVAPAVLSDYLQAVDSTQLNSTLVIDDFSKIISLEKDVSRSPSQFSWRAYYDIDSIYGYLKNMSTWYSDVATLVGGGRSYEGRPILGLRIVTRAGNGHIKPAIFIESGIHAREWIAPATITYFIYQLLTSQDNRIRALRDSFDWHIFPSVNPDGYHYTHTRDRMWRKTRSRTSSNCYGVDANRNWNHNWMVFGASSDPCHYELYAGSKPFSEVETFTLAQYIASVKNLMGYIGFHSYGPLLLVPYSDSKDHMDNYDDLVRIGRTSLYYGSRVTNEPPYRPPATAAEILYPASGGSMDWVREKLRTPLVFTFELRGINFHWPPERIPEQGDEVTQMMLGLCTEAANLGYF